MAKTDAELIVQALRDEARWLSGDSDTINCLIATAMGRLADRIEDIRKCDTPACDTCGCSTTPGEVKCWECRMYERGG